MLKHPAPTPTPTITTIPRRRIIRMYDATNRGGRVALNDGVQLQQLMSVRFEPDPNDATQIGVEDISNSDVYFGDSTSRRTSVATTPVGVTHNFRFIRFKIK